MLDKQKLIKEFEERVNKNTSEYKTCIGILNNMKGYRIVGERVYFYLGGEKTMGCLTYPDVNKMMFNAISEKGNKDSKYNIPEMNEKCQVIK